MPTQNPYKAWLITYSCPHCPDNKCKRPPQEEAQTKAYGHSKRTAIASFNRSKGCRYMKAIEAVELR